MPAARAMRKRSHLSERSAADDAREAAAQRPEKSDRHRQTQEQREVERVEDEPERVVARGREERAMHCERRLQGDERLVTEEGRNAERERDREGAREN